MLVIMERYASILNFKDQRMIQIDEGSKKPLKKHEFKNSLKESMGNILIDSYEMP